jgi:hypothetical protein
MDNRRWWHVVITNGTDTVFCHEMAEDESEVEENWAEQDGVTIVSREPCPAGHVLACDQ